MASHSFRQITRSFRWLHLVLFIGLPLAAVLTAALVLGTQRIIDQAKDKVELDFFALATYLHTQTRYLENLQQRHKELPDIPISMPAEYARTTRLTDHRPYLYQVRPSLADIPYAILCLDLANCPARDNATGSNLHAIGDFLSDAYSAYWARSYFPGATTLLVDLSNDISLIVPADNGTLRKELLSPQSLLQTTLLINQSSIELAQEPRQPVHWLRSEHLPCCLISIADAAMTPGTWHIGPGEKAPRVVMATISDLSRTALFAQISAAPFYSGFWLQHNGQTLIGANAPPSYPETGVQLAASGVVYGFTDKTGQWTGIYTIRYADLFRANPWLPFTALSLLLLGLIGGVLYARWYNRKVVLPIQTTHQALQESEAFNRTLLDTAPVALCVLEQGTGKVLFANALAYQWLELNATEKQEPLLPKNLLPEDVLQAETIGTCDNLHIAERSLQVAYAPTRYRHQTAVLCAFVDLSVRARYETALQQAKAEADSANAAKTHFLAAMSHEIRTPLYGILGTMELLSKTSLTTAQQQQVKRLQQSSSILMQLISDILDLTKIEAGQMALSISSFCPRHLVQQCIDGFSDVAHHKGLQLFSCVDPAVPDAVTGDALRIRQVLNNFLSNAIKFTAAGQVVARLRSRTQNDGLVELTFQVVDSGVGIHMDDQKRLFTPFYQVAATHKMPQGTGLGLSISNNLARLMGGRILLTSEQGLGSSFSLQLTLSIDTSPALPAAPTLSNLDVQVHSPHAELSQNLSQWLKKWGAEVHCIPPAQTPDCATANSDTILIDVLPTRPLRPANWPGRYLVAGPAHAKAIAHADAHIQAYGPDAIARGLLGLSEQPDTKAATSLQSRHDTPLGLKILVAEDNPINQATLKEQLELLGCTVSLSSNGADALQRWFCEQYDAVLTDLNMPRMNGYELTEALRQAGVKAPIIGVTANAMRQEEEDCRRAGMTDWVVKPIDLGTLRRLLGNIEPQSKAPSQTRSAIQQAAAELGRIPERHRALFKQSLLADATALLNAVDSGQPSLIGQALHRMHGALLVMHQQSLSKRIETAQDALRANEHELSQALCDDILHIAQDLQHLIETHMPT